MVTNFLTAISNIQNVLKNVLLLNCPTPKTNHSILCYYFATDGPRKVDINTKIASFQCSCIKWLYDNSFLE